MALVNNAEILGKSGRNLVLQTAGHVYVKVNEHYYELDFKNQNSKGQVIGNLVSDEDVKGAEEVDLTDYVTNEDLRRTLKKYVTERSFQDVKNTQQMLENSLLDFTESIKPMTVQTMQVMVGTDELQFDWVTSFEDMKSADVPMYKDYNEFNADGTPNENYGQLVFQPGYIKHYTIDGPDTITPENESSVKDYWRWYILNSEGVDETELVNMSDNYYVYLKVPYMNYASVDTADVPGAGPHGGNVYCTRMDDDEDYNQVWEPAADSGLGKGVYSKTGVGRVVYSHDAIEYGPIEENGVTYYHLLYAIVNNDDGTPSVSQMNGFTEITPGQIRAYIFANAEGTSYLDLRKNVLVLGEDVDKPKFAYNVAGDGTLYIDGAIVQNTQIQDGGGNKSDLTVYRGEWSEGTQYCPSNTVIVSNGGSIESYRFKGEECTTETGNPLTDTVHWECISKGSESVITRVRKFQNAPDSGTDSLIYNDGSTEESDHKKYLDFVYYNGLYYQCVTYQKYLSTKNPIQIPGEESGWTLINNFKPVATSVLLAGKDSTGWIIDEGAIKHSGHLAEITKYGTIALGNKVVITWANVADSSEKLYSTYGFDQDDEIGTINLNKSEYNVYDDFETACWNGGSTQLDAFSNTTITPAKGTMTAQTYTYGDWTVPYMIFNGKRYSVNEITPITFNVDINGCVRMVNLKCYGGSLYLNKIGVGSFDGRPNNTSPAGINSAGDFYCQNETVMGDLDVFGKTISHPFGSRYGRNKFLVSSNPSETLDNTATVYNYSGSVSRDGTLLTTVNRTGSFVIMDQTIEQTGTFQLPTISFGFSYRNIKSVSFTLSVLRDNSLIQLNATGNEKWIKQTNDTFKLSSISNRDLDLGSIIVKANEVIKISVSYSIWLYPNGEITTKWNTYGLLYPNDATYFISPIYKFLKNGISFTVGNSTGKSMFRMDADGIKLSSHNFEIKIDEGGIHKIINGIQTDL